jgi:hypothetical protein
MLWEMKVVKPECPGPCLQDLFFCCQFDQCHHPEPNSLSQFALSQFGSAVNLLGSPSASSVVSPVAPVAIAVIPPLTCSLHVSRACDVGTSGCETPPAVNQYGGAEDCAQTQKGTAPGGLSEQPKGQQSSAEVSLSARSSLL